MQDLPGRPFVFMRHGETAANRARLIVGRSDVSLNDTGRLQADAAAGHFAAGGPYVVHASPMLRAVETASRALPHAEVHLDARLRERDWGELENQPLSRLTDRLATPPGGESFDSVRTRVFTALNDILSAAPDRLPVIVAHSGVARALVSILGGEAEGRRFGNALPFLFQTTSTGWKYAPYEFGEGGGDAV